MGVKRISLKVSDKTYEFWDGLAKARGLSLTKMLIGAVESSISPVAVKVQPVVTDIPQDGVTVEPIPGMEQTLKMAEFIEGLPHSQMPKAAKGVPQIAGVSKASEWKPPMPSLPKYQPKPEKRGKK